METARLGHLFISSTAPAQFNDDDRLLHRCSVDNVYSATGPTQQYFIVVYSSALSPVALPGPCLDQNAYTTTLYWRDDIDMQIRTGCTLNRLWLNSVRVRYMKQSAKHLLLIYLNILVPVYMYVHIYILYSNLRGPWENQEPHPASDSDLRQWTTQRGKFNLFSY